MALASGAGVITPAGAQAVPADGPGQALTVRLRRRALHGSALARRRAGPGRHWAAAVAELQACWARSR